MREMYDSVTAANIPRNAEMVAGYVDPDGTYTWSDADWAMFPNSVKVRIAGHASTEDGHVLDVEDGDATPAQAPWWCTRRRQAGVVPSVYCSESVWDAVKHQFDVQNVQYPQWWIAGYPGSVGANLYPGSVAHQYIDVGPYDLSVVADYWPGVDDGPSPDKPKEATGMYILYTQTQCAVFFGNVKERDFTGARDPLYNVPLDAIAYSQGQIPVRLTSDFVFKLIVNVSDHLLIESAPTK